MSNERTVVFHLPTVVAGSLAAISGTVAGRTFPLTAGTFVIGRQPELDLSLPSEPGVSKVHAKIVAEGDHYVLYDAESRNGTIVNGRPVQRVRLYDGDEIQICGCTLRFTQTAGGGVQVRNPPSVDERLAATDTSRAMAELPTRGASDAGLPRRDTAAGFELPRTSAYDHAQSAPPQSAYGAPTSATGPALAPLTTEAFPPRQTASSMEPTYVAPPPQAVPRRSPAPWFVVGMLVSMLGGGSVYAMFLMSDESRAAMVANDATAAPPDETRPDATKPDATKVAVASPPGDATTPPADAPTETAPVVDPGNAGAEPSMDAPPADDAAGAAPAADDVEAAADDEPEAPADEPATALDEPAPEPAKKAPRAARSSTRARSKAAVVEDDKEPAAANDEQEAPEPAGEAAVVATTTSEPSAPGEGGVDGTAVADAPSAASAASASSAAPAQESSAATASSAPKLAWIAAVPVPPKKAAVRVAAGGRVKSVDATDGDLVVEGDTLVTFEQAVDAADIATLKESIRALESIVESGGSSEAEVMLKQEQERLARLEAGQQQGRVGAPASGTLEGLTAKVGEKLRAKQVIGQIVSGNAKAITAVVDRDVGAKLKKGAKVRVRSASRGELDGVVVASKKKGAKYQLTIDVIGGDAADVDAVRVP